MKNYDDLIKFHKNLTTLTQSLVECNQFLINCTSEKDRRIKVQDTVNQLHFYIDRHNIDHDLINLINKKIASYEADIIKLMLTLPGVLDNFEEKIHVEVL